MKVLSFLGTGGYGETRYVFGANNCTTKFFPVAACTFFSPSPLLVAMTKGSRDKWWKELSANITERFPQVPLVEVDIPDGRTEADVWEIFETLVAQFQPGDEVVIDITHGYRSLPVIAVISAAFLREARDVRVRGLVYGAYDPQSPIETPVLDLTPFLELNDWTSAVSLFQWTGNAEPLAALLVQTQDRLYRAPERSPDLPRALKTTGKSLADLSEAMRLIRVRDVLRLARELDGRLVTAEAEARRWARPFAVLLDQMRQEYAPFTEAPDDNLAIQLDLIRWYIQKHWWVEAAALAREWLVSLQTRQMDLDRIAGRHAAETALNSAAHALRGVQVQEGDGEGDSPRLKGDIVDQLAPAPEITALWNTLNDFRNDLAHPAARSDPRPAAAVRQQIADLAERLAAVYQAFAAPEEN